MDAHCRTARLFLLIEFCKWDFHCANLAHLSNSLKFLYSSSGCIKRAICVPFYLSTHQEPPLQICPPTEKELHSSLAACSTAHTFPFSRDTKIWSGTCGQIVEQSFCWPCAACIGGALFSPPSLSSGSFHFLNYQKQRAKYILCNGDNGASSSKRFFRALFVYCTHFYLLLVAIIRSWKKPIRGACLLYWNWNRSYRFTMQWF